VQAHLKRKLAIGTTLLAAAAFAGGAFAATQDPSTSPEQTFLRDAAKRLNVTPAQLTAAFRGAYLDELSAAVAAGKLTNAQADAIRKRIQQSGVPPLEGWGGFGPLGLGPRLHGAPGPGLGPRLHGAPGPGLGPRFYGAPGAAGAPPPFGERGGPSAAARYLGLTEQQLMAQLSAGKSLAQIAQARGKSTAGLKSALTAAVTARLDRVRTAGMITRAQEQQLVSHLSARLDAEISHAGLPGPGMFFHGREGGAPGFRPAPDHLPGGAGGPPPAGAAGAGAAGAGTPGRYGSAAPPAGATLSY
jgi:hypothetical protein